MVVYLELWSPVATSDVWELIENIKPDSLGCFYTMALFYAVLGS